MKKFKPDFLLGAATAAHQVEGNNINSDYWAQEHMRYTSFKEPSGLACDHYNRYREDIRMLAKAGLNAYRFSIEWARIEPEEGKFDEKEISHYRDVIRCCKENGVTPVMTLMHFSSPKWLITKGGWEAESTVEDFRRYCTYVMERLGSELEYVCTINEANMGLQVAAIARQIMKQMREAKKENAAQDAKGSLQVGFNYEELMKNMENTARENMEVFGTAQPQGFVSQRTAEGDILVMRAHRAAVEAIRSLCPHIRVGLTLSLNDTQCEPGGEAEAAAAWNEEFSHYLPYLKGDDFIGIQNYTRAVYGPEGRLPIREGAIVTQMDHEFYPQSLEHVVRRVAGEFAGDLIVTENGIATDDDTLRVALIETALTGIQSCLDDGLPVKGYFHWSLMDNFEWQQGYAMQFGLVAVDRNTMERTAKPSLKYLGSWR